MGRICKVNVPIKSLIYMHHLSDCVCRRTMTWLVSYAVYSALSVFFMQQCGHCGVLGAFISALLCNLPHRVHCNSISGTVGFPGGKKNLKIKKCIKQGLEILAGRQGSAAHLGSCSAWQSLWSPLISTAWFLHLCGPWGGFLAISEAVSSHEGCAWEGNVLAVVMNTGMADGWAVIT